MDDAWLDDYCQRWQYDDDLINQANYELAELKENDE